MEEDDTIEAEKVAKNLRWGEDLQARLLSKLVMSRIYPNLKRKPEEMNAVKLE